MEPTEEEVQKQVRETLEKLQGKASKGKGAKYRREKRDQHRQQTEKDLEQQELNKEILVRVRRGKRVGGGRDRSSGRRRRSVEEKLHSYTSARTRNDHP